MTANTNKLTLAVISFFCVITITFQHETNFERIWTVSRQSGNHSFTSFTASNIFPQHPAHRGGPLSRVLRTDRQQSLSFHTRKTERRTVTINPSCTCGARPFEPVKIVGGHLSHENAWPWLASLVQTGGTKPMGYCGASLINTQSVTISRMIEKSHCITDVPTENPTTVEALFGSNTISNPNAIRVAIKSIKMHPNYVAKTMENDIALVKLVEPVTFSDNVGPICLKPFRSSYVGLTGTVAGWGSIKSNQPGVDKLREVKVRVISNSQCKKDYSKVNIKIENPMICASLPGKDSCQGDSGGPFFMKNHNLKTYTQIGVVSFGFGCAKPSFPGVYARVASFIEWIQENTQDATYCRKSF